MPEVAANADRGACSPTWLVAEPHGLPAPGTHWPRSRPRRPLVDIEADSAGVVLQTAGPRGRDGGGRHADRRLGRRRGAGRGRGRCCWRPWASTKARPTRLSRTPSPPRPPSPFRRRRTPSPSPAGPGVFASPLARKIAREAGVDLAAVPGTGPGGRIRRRDVDAFVAARTASPSGPAAPAPQSRRHRPTPTSRTSRMRQAIAAPADREQADDAALLRPGHGPGRSAARAARRAQRAAAT